jgi:RNA polymerase sigma-70 factor (ECF subfamily)
MEIIGDNHIVKFNKGNKTAFDLIYNGYHRSVVFVAKKYVNNKEDALEIAADSFVKLWQKREEFKSIKHVAAFLFAATRNASIDHLRNIRRQSVKEKELYRALEENEDAQRDLEVEAETYKRILVAIDELPHKYRNVFKLLSSGLSPHEVAKLVNLPLKTIYTQKDRAIAHLRSKVLKHKLLFFFLLVFFAVLFTKI